MKLIPTSDFDRKLLAIGLEAIEIRKKRFIPFGRLNKYFGLNYKSMGNAHMMALHHLNVICEQHTNEKSVKFSTYIELPKYDSEPLWMDNAQTTLREPLWMNKLTREQLLGIYANI